jgi:hypothetical protein
MRSDFPAEWKLSDVQAALLTRLYEGEGVVAHDALDAVLISFRRGKVGRPVKVVLHYLRARVQPRGIFIRSCKKAGYQLDAESRPLLAPFISPEPTAAEG